MSSPASTDPDPPPLRARSRLAAADAIVSALFLMLGVYIAFASVTRYQAFSQGQVGPGVLPLLIGATMILTSGLVLIRLWRAQAAATDADMPTAPELARVAKLLALMVACVTAMPMVGAIVTLGLFVLVETALIEKRGWLLSVMTAVAIPLLLYVFFEVLLGVPLPAGRIGLL